MNALFAALAVAVALALPSPAPNPTPKPTPKPAPKAARSEAPSAADTGAATPHAPKLRVIALDPKKPKTVIKAMAAPGLATVIQLPEAWAQTPTCGDCVFGDDSPEGQLFRLDVFPETRTLSLKPTRVPGPDAPAAAFITNIDITLVGGISATLFVELALPEQADARIELTIPEEASSSARLTKKERELEDAFAGRLKDSANDLFLTGLMAGTECKDFWGHPNRSDGLVVRLKQLCRNGALVYVTFEIENRLSTEALIGGASLSDAAGAASSLHKIERDCLRFNDRATGIAAIELPSKDQKPTSYSLTVTEDEGQSRTITIDDISF